MAYYIYKSHDIGKGGEEGSTVIRKEKISIKPTHPEPHSQASVYTARASPR
jgi:hypothetical protein